MTLLVVYHYVTKIFFVIVMGIFLVVGISVIPIPGNYKIYSVLSGSMSPSIRTGSIVLVKPMKSYRIGDVVTFRTPIARQTATHRITGQKRINSTTVFITKGDANKSKDSEPLYPQNIIGRVFFSIPLVGFVIAFAKTLPGLISLIIIPSTIIVYSELLTIKRELMRIIDKEISKKTSSKKK